MNIKELLAQIRITEIPDNADVILVVNNTEYEIEFAYSEEHNEEITRLVLVQKENK